MSAEAKLEREVRLYAEKRGILTYKFSSPAHRGVPDRIFVAPRGKVLFLELKAPGKKPTPLQFRELRRLQENGANATWTSSFSDAMGLIEKLLI